jgi:hypothetical protein
LGVFFLLLRKFVVPFIVAGYSVQRATSFRPWLVIELVCECSALSIFFGCDNVFVEPFISIGTVHYNCLQHLEQ